MFENKKLKFNIFKKKCNNLIFISKNINVPGKKLTLSRNLNVFDGNSALIDRGLIVLKFFSHEIVRGVKF